MRQARFQITLKYQIIGLIYFITQYDEVLPRSRLILRSVGAASRAEMLAKRLGLNANSQAKIQVLYSLDGTVEEVIIKFRKIF